MLKRTLFASAIALSTIVPAMAEVPNEALPLQFVGNWCAPIAKDNAGEAHHRLKECNIGDIRYTITRTTIQIQEGNSGPGLTCKLRRLIKVRDNDYVAKYDHCGEFVLNEGIEPQTWQLTLKGDGLFVRWTSAESN